MVQEFAAPETVQRAGAVGGSPRARYSPALSATVTASAAPYGYTLTIWTSGALLSHARGIPSTAKVLLFMVGAVAAYALVGRLALSWSRERFAPGRGQAVAWGSLHVCSVGLAIGAVSLVAHFVANIAAWPLGGFLATTLYLVVSAGQLAFARAVRPGDRSGQAGGR